MKKIFVLFMALSAASVFAQDATQAQIDKLSGQIQDLLASQEQQAKRIEALSKEISELRDTINAPRVNTSASNEDLKALAEKVQEVDKKRQEDRQVILKAIEKLGKTDGGSGHSRPTTTSGPATSPDTTPTTPQKGYYYAVQSGDTLAAVAKAYRDQGVKVTTAQILKANPGLDANKLIVGKKIFIPDPNAQ